MTPGHWIDPFDANPRPKPLGIPQGRLERIKAEEPPVAQPDRWACAMPSDAPQSKCACGKSVAGVNDGNGGKHGKMSCVFGSRQLLVAQTTEPAAKEAEWVEWKGGECPVPLDTKVEVRILNRGEIRQRIDVASWFANGCGYSDWLGCYINGRGNGACDRKIIAYRLIPQGAQS